MAVGSFFGSNGEAALCISFLTLDFSSMILVSLSVRSERTHPNLSMHFSPLKLPGITLTPHTPLETQVDATTRISLASNPPFDDLRQYVSVHSTHPLLRAAINKKKAKSYKQLLLAALSMRRRLAFLSQCVLGPFIASFQCFLLFRVPVIGCWRPRTSIETPHLPRRVKES